MGFINQIGKEEFIRDYLIGIHSSIIKIEFEITIRVSSIQTCTDGKINLFNHIWFITTIILPVDLKNHI